MCGVIMEGLKQAADSLLNTDESEKSLYDKRLELHQQSLRIAKSIDMFNPNDIGLLEQEYHKVKSISTHRSKSKPFSNQFIRNLSLKRHNISKNKQKVAEIMNKSSERIHKKLNIDPEDSLNAIHILPSVKHSKRSLFSKQISNHHLILTP